MPTVELTRTFGKHLKSLPPHRQKKVGEAINRFVTDPATPSLDYRPLRGTADHYLIDSTSRDRLILRQIHPGHYEIADVGPHDNVLRRWNR